MMDLVTLVTLCSLGVDPKLMHALVWRQSGGEPWSFTVPGEREPRVYRKLRDAVHEANALHTYGLIRAGLTGLVTNASAVTETTFLPCPNMPRRPTRSISSLRAARPIHSPTPTTPSAPSPLITGPGSAPTRPSPGLFAQLFRIMPHRTLTCPKKPGSRFGTLCSTRRPLPKRVLPRGRNTRPKTTNTPGRAHCFRQSQNVPTMRRAPRPSTLRLQRIRSRNANRTSNLRARTQ